ncbi:hypothetical protein RJ639_026291 [Escallonia herrerae]|uniref:F-box/kelch-repeat protein n=1 Tax=Escallonia herrerae TaxID=1293975 RepID=A0AA88SQL7_9ASTE|nr:hypothetical protein RJ639_026291 [Escallonia herrerae]
MPNVVYNEEHRKGLSGLLTWNLVGPYTNIVNLMRRWLRWNDEPEALPFSGYATGALGSCLYVLGGFSRDSAMRCVWKYDPVLNAWSEVPPMSIGRAYCRTSVLNKKLYVVGGLVRVLEEMPTGMGDGWPARQVGTKLSVVVDGELYSFNLSSSLNSGKIKVYDQKEDASKVVIEKVPKCDFADTESPYLLAAFHRKLNFIAKDANHDIAVMQADKRDDLSTLTSTSSSILPHCLLEHSDRIGNSCLEGHYNKKFWVCRASELSSGEYLVLD